MKICGQEVEGIVREQVFSTVFGRKALKFIDTKSGYINYFPLPDYDPPDGALDSVNDVLGLYFVMQVQAYRASMKMIATMEREQDDSPLAAPGTGNH